MLHMQHFFKNGYVMIEVKLVKVTFEDVKDLDLFEDVTAEQFQEFMRKTGSYGKTYKKGSYISLSEDEVRSISLILEGTVHMESEDVWGNKTILLFLRKNQLFGESFAVRSDAVSVVNFYAATDVRSLCIPFKELIRLSSFKELMQTKFMENLMSMLADKNVRLMQKLIILSKRSLREKLLTYFWMESKRRGTKKFEIPIGRVGLGEFLCADRSALTRELSRMRKEGLIDYEKNTFELLRDEW